VENATRVEVFDSNPVLGTDFAARLNQLQADSPFAFGYVRTAQKRELGQRRFLVVQFDAHVSEAHLLWASPINTLEITVEVADLGITAIAGDGLNRLSKISQQLGSPCHPHLKQVPPQRLPHFHPEQAANPSLSEAQQATDLARSHRQNASALIYDSQQNSNACVHYCSSIMTRKTLADGDGGGPYLSLYRWPEKPGPEEITFWKQAPTEKRRERNSNRA
jgi:hypothetical protein